MADDFNAVDHILCNILIPFIKFLCNVVCKIHEFLSNELSSNQFNEQARVRPIPNVIAMDCEMVGAGHDRSISMLARVTLVNSNGEILYNKYVKPIFPVTDYRTNVSGIRPHHIQNGEDFLIVRQEVAEMLFQRILVGHSLQNDLNALMLKHPWKNIRDTQKFSKFRKPFGRRDPSLKKLARLFLSRKIQYGEHDSAEDARAAVDLYMKYRDEWENKTKHIILY